MAVSEMLIRVRTAWLPTCAAMLMICADAVAQARGPAVRSPAVSSRENVDRVETVGIADPVARAAKLAELEAWLRQLEGQFQLQGTVTSLAIRIVNMVGTPAGRGAGPGIEVGLRCDGQHCFMDRERTGVVACEAFAYGPGILCAIRVPWPLFRWSPANFRASEIPFRGPVLGGAMILYGIDPDNLGIRFLMVDGEGIAVEALGFLQDDKATFRRGCLNVVAGQRLPRRCEWEFQVRVQDDGESIVMQFDTTPTPFAAYKFTSRRAGVQ